MRGGWLFGLVLVGCAASGGARVPEPSSAVAASPAPAPAAPVAPGAIEAGWVAATEAPSAGDPDSAPLDSRETTLTGACGATDAALVHVARAIAAAAAEGAPTPDPDAIGLLLRRMGVPHTRPRLLSAKGKAPLDVAALPRELAKIRGHAGRPLCGVAIAKRGADEIVVALAVDALADLAPLPVRARTGQWLTLDAKLLVPARSARLVVLGPRGLPRTVPTSLDARTQRTKARFVLDRPGDFTVQLVAELDEGPRPILEARVFADATPGDTVETMPAPGEAAGRGASDAAALERMIATLRSEESAGPLRRDAKLDVLAQRHAEAMRAKRRAAHDVGDGDLGERFAAEGDSAKTIGENVAHARSLGLAHRALFASPSHRANLLRADYTHIGVAVAADDDGSVYVCEVFASR